MNPFVSIIIVTHNSQSVLEHCLAAIDCQTVQPGQVIIVDSGSEDCSYLDIVRERKEYTVLKFANIGYAAGNNRGLQVLDSACNYVLILNPDTFLSPPAIEQSVKTFENLPDVALLTGLLEGYDLGGSGPTGKIDSSGIFRSCYGRWHDRGHGQTIGTGCEQPGYVPAICGAFIFFRLSSVRTELPELFDESFFMYKEDIELCIRLTRKGLKFYYSPDIRAYHCRGWGQRRRSIPRTSRLMSAQNEVRIYRKHPSVYMAWARLKYLLVRYLNM